MADYFWEGGMDGIFWIATNWKPYGIPGYPDPPMFMPWPPEKLEVSP